MESDRQIGLSLEQQFTLRAFEEQIKNASLEQAKALLYDLYRQLLLRETYFKDFIKQSVLPDFPSK
jgi:hypothetical protein